MYRGDAVGQVVLAGNTQQFILRQLEATEGTRSSFLLQLRLIRATEVQMGIKMRSQGQNGQEEMIKQRMDEEGKDHMDSPNHRLNLLPVLWVDVISVLRSHQHGSEAEGRVLQSGAVTFNYC